MKWIEPGLLGCSNTHTFLRAMRGELLPVKTKIQLCGMVLFTSPSSLFNCHVAPERGWNYTEKRGANNYDGEPAGRSCRAQSSARSVLEKEERKVKGAFSAVTGLRLTGCDSDGEQCTRASEKWHNKTEHQEGLNVPGWQMERVDAKMQWFGKWKLENGMQGFPRQGANTKTFSHN